MRGDDFIDLNEVVRSIEAIDDGYEHMTARSDRASVCCCRRGASKQCTECAFRIGRFLYPINFSKDSVEREAFSKQFRFRQRKTQWKNEP